MSVKHVWSVVVVGVAFGTACSVASPDGAADGERFGSAAQRIELAADAGADAAGCVHGICQTGGALVATCDPCATALCAVDPYCCSTEWDATCVGEVSSVCGQSCTAPPPPPADSGASTCAHPICAVGGPLAAGCEPTCSAQLCALDPYCCSTSWDATCVGEVASICGLTCN